MLRVEETLQGTPLNEGYERGWLRIGALRGGVGWPRTDAQAYLNAVLFLRFDRHSKASASVDMFRLRDEYDRQESDKDCVDKTEPMLNASRLLAEHAIVANDLISEAVARLVRSKVVWTRLREEAHSSTAAWVMEAVLPVKFEMTTARLVPDEREDCADKRGCIVGIGINMIDVRVPVQRRPDRRSKVNLEKMTRLLLMEIFIREMYETLAMDAFRHVAGSYILVGEKMSFQPPGFVECCLNPANADFFFRNATKTSQARSRKRRRAEHFKRRGNQRD